MFNNMKNAKYTIPFLALVLLISVDVGNSLAQELENDPPSNYINPPM